MIVSLSPRLEGSAAERFLALARTLYLVAERPRVSRLTPEEIRKEKGKTQALFRPAVEAQLRDPAVRNFVTRMESPSVKSGKKPVTALIADGPELHDRLLNAARTHVGESDVFAGAVSPCLQLVTPTGTDQFTGHSLREIWR